MKLFSYRHVEDFGDSWAVAFLKGKKLALLQIEVAWNVYGCKYPWMQLWIGNGRLLGGVLMIGKVSIDFDIIGRTWHWNIVG